MNSAGETIMKLLLKQKMQGVSSLPNDNSAIT